MNSLAFAGLLTFLFPWLGQPKFSMPEWPEQAAQATECRKSGTVDLKGHIHVLGKIPRVVEEYGRPAAHIFADGAKLKNFAWRGSMEGVHVGSQPFNSTGMRRKHKAIQVTLENLFCDDVGEDAISIQPRAIVTLRNSRIQGNWARPDEQDRTLAGQDKLVQIDGAEVLIENCDFFHARTAIRGKANSRITIKNCRFVKCSVCVNGDGLDNPRKRQTYDNGKRGRCKITLINCEAWDCGTLARAMDGCEIEVINCKTHGDGDVATERGGKVSVKKN